MKTVATILIFGVITLCPSCKGQNTSERIKSPETTSMPGKTVAKLDKKILQIFQDSNDNYWFGGNDKGAYKYDGETLTLYTVSDGLCSGNVIGIQEDNHGNLYFDTPKGVSKFDGQMFKTLEIDTGNTSKHEWTLTKDDLWFKMGIGANGPYRYDGLQLSQLELPTTEISKEFYAKYPNASYNPSGIYSTYRDRQGNMWFGTSSIGVWRLDGKSLRWLYEEQLQETPSGGDFGMRSIIEDKDGYFWFNNPRYRYEILTDSIEEGFTGPLKYRKEEGIASSTIGNPKDLPYFLSMTEDNNGDLWGATYSDGVWKMNSEECIHYPVKDGDMDVLLFYIYKDNQGVLWLGTHNAGVYKFNGVSFEKPKISG